MDIRYDSIILKAKGTIGTILKENGYATSGSARTTRRRPIRRSGRTVRPGTDLNGLRIFYGFFGGAPSVGTEPVSQDDPIYPFQGNPGWNLTTAMADEAIHYMKQLKEIARQAVLCLLRAGRHACTAQSDAGRDQLRSATWICSTGAGTRCARQSSPIRSALASCRGMPNSLPGRKIAGVGLA